MNPEQNKQPGKLNKNLKRRLSQGSQRWKMQEVGISAAELERLKFQKYLKNETDSYDQDS